MKKKYTSGHGGIGTATNIERVNIIYDKRRVLTNPDKEKLIKIYKNICDFDITSTNIFEFNRLVRDYFYMGTKASLLDDRYKDESLLCINQVQTIRKLYSASPNKQYVVDNLLDLYKTLQLNIRSLISLMASNSEWKFTELDLSNEQLELINEKEDLNNKAKEQSEQERRLRELQSEANRLGIDISEYINSSMPLNERLHTVEKIVNDGLNNERREIIRQNSIIDAKQILNKIGKKEFNAFLSNLDKRKSNNECKLILAEIERLFEFKPDDGVEFSFFKESDTITSKEIGQWDKRFIDNRGIVLTEIYKDQNRVDILRSNIKLISFIYYVHRKVMSFCEDYKEAESLLAGMGDKSFYQGYDFYNHRDFYIKALKERINIHKSTEEIECEAVKTYNVMAFVYKMVYNEDEMEPGLFQKINKLRFNIARRQKSLDKAIQEAKIVSYYMFKYMHIRDHSPDRILNIFITGDKQRIWEYNFKRAFELYNRDNANFDWESELKLFSDKEKARRYMSKKNIKELADRKQYVLDRIQQLLTKADYDKTKKAIDRWADKADTIKKADCLTVLQLNTLAQFLDITLDEALDILEDGKLYNELTEELYKRSMMQ